MPDVERGRGAGDHSGGVDPGAIPHRAPFTAASLLAPPAPARHIDLLAGMTWAALDARPGL